jgi:hypothetical protein
MSRNARSPSFNIERDIPAKIGDDFKRFGVQ